MRISDWSSDVCSSDLRLAAQQRPDLVAGERLVFQESLGDRMQLIDVLGQRRPGAGIGLVDDPTDLHVDLSCGMVGHEIGRAACRERVGLYGQIQAVALLLINKNMY